jgi:hypothetical protein
LSWKQKLAENQNQKNKRVVKWPQGRGVADSGVGCNRRHAQDIASAQSRAIPRLSQDRALEATGTLLFKKRKKEKIMYVKTNLEEARITALVGRTRRQCSYKMAIGGGC